MSYSVREKAKELTALLKDDSLIESEREAAKALREKLGGGKTQGIGSSSSTYEGYGSNAFNSETKFKSSGLNSKAYKYDTYSGDRKYHDSSAKYQDPKSYDTYYEKKPEISFQKPAEPHKDDVFVIFTFRMILESSKPRTILIPLDSSL